MSLTTTFRTMEKRLRMVLISTGLLLIPSIGQFLTISSINQDGHESTLAFFFEFAAIFLIPTALILTGVIVWMLRHEWRSHRPIMLLGALNILIAINLTWFFFHPCSWSQVVGIVLKSCAQ